MGWKCSWQDDFPSKRTGIGPWDGPTPCSILCTAPGTPAARHLYVWGGYSTVQVWPERKSALMSPLPCLAVACAFWAVTASTYETAGSR